MDLLTEMIGIATSKFMAIALLFAYYTIRLRAYMAEMENAAVPLKINLSHLHYIDFQKLQTPRQDTL